MVPGNLGTLCSDAALLAKQQDSLEGFSSCVLRTGTSLDIQREVAVEHLSLWTVGRDSNFRCIGITYHIKASP